MAEQYRELTVEALQERNRELSERIEQLEEKLRAAQQSSLQPELLRRERRQQVIARLSLVALQEQDIQQFLRVAVRAVRQALNADFCEVLELQPAGEQLLLKAGSGWDDSVVGHAMLPAAADSQAGYTLYTGQSVKTDDLRREERFAPSALLLDQGVVSSVSCVIRDGDVYYGVLGVHSRRQGAFGVEDAEFLHAVANVIGIATIRHLLHKRSAIEMAVARILADASTLEEAVERLFELFGRELSAAICEFWMPEESGDAEGVLECRYFKTPQQPQLEQSWRDSFNHRRFRSGEGLIGRVWENGGAQWIPALLEDKHFARREQARQLGLQGGFAFCVKHAEGCVGVISIFSQQHLLPDRKVLRMLESTGEAVGEFVRRVEAEAHWQQSQQRLRLATQAAELGIFDYDIVNNSIYWDAHLRCIWGVDADTPVDYSVFERGLHPDDRAPVREAVERALRADSSHAYEATYRVISRKTGAERTVTAKGEVFFEGDRPTRMVGIVQDITERERLELAVRENQQRFRTLADNISQFAWMTDADGSIFWYNKRWYEYTGTTPEQMLGWGWTRLHHPDHVDRVVRSITHSFQTGEPWEDIFPLRSAQGDYRWFLSRALPIRDEAGAIIGWFGTNTDITEQREAEHQLRTKTEQLARSQQRYRDLVEGLDGIVFEYDVSTARFTFVSPRAESLLGYQPARWLGEKDLWRDEILHPEDRDHVLAEMARCAEHGMDREVTYRARHSNGEWVWMRDIMRLERPQDGGGGMIRGMMIDVTQEVQQQQSLREMDQQKDHYLAMLGHELRNPLAAIRSGVDLLKLAHTDDPAIVRSREILHRQVAHMNTLVDGLLDVSRIARGKLSLKARTIDLLKVVREAVRDRFDQIHQRGLQLEMSLPGESVWVFGDAVRLTQVMDNLLGNAIKFSSVGDTISVSLLRETVPGGERAVVAVRDTGAGIDPDVRDHLFEPFRQGSQDIARTAGGLGLGLALSKRLLELHGGEIVAEDNRDGPGSTFRFMLPLVTPGKLRVAGEQRSTGGGSERSARLLVVEDNDDVAEMLRTLLEAADYRVSVVYTAEQALSLLRDDQHFDAVLCDLGLPDISGYELARRIHQSGNLERLPLVAVSGYGQNHAQQQAAEAGFVAHLTKPVRIEQIKKVLSAIT